VHLGRKKKKPARTEKEEEGGHELLIKIMGVGRHRKATGEGRARLCTKWDEKNDVGGGKRAAAPNGSREGGGTNITEVVLKNVY